MIDSTTTLVRKVVQRQPASTFSHGLHRFIGGLDYRGNGHDFPIKEVDPFIIVDTGLSIGAGKPGFGSHPHCGFSVTSLIMAGRYKSWDSLQQKWEDDRVAGSVYWVNCGRGIMHDELSVDEGPNSLFQIWMNIPDSKRNEKANVQFLHADNVPGVKLNNDKVNVRVLVGSFEGKTSPIVPVNPVTILHIQQEPGNTIHIPLDPTYNAIVINGTLSSNSSKDSKAIYSGTKSEILELLILDRGGGDHLEVITGEGSAEYLVLSGKPVDELWVKRIGYNGGLITRTPEEAEAKMKEFEEKREKFGLE